MNLRNFALVVLGLFASVGFALAVDGLARRRWGAWLVVGLGAVMAALLGVVAW